MKRIILGTAGHIDHGKTALIKVLTGVDLDRLPEEKKRGIIIELGFTSLTLPSGQVLGIVDVPGHERFVKTMLAGAHGIDLVLLVVDASEGVMPQTKEHLDICTLLKIKRGLITITKRDLVGPEWLELVREDIKGLVKGTFLEDSPIIAVSSLTGEGISQLIKALDELSQKVEERSSEGLFRLSVDRVFGIKGFGTVVTGTLISGKVSTGETIEILPQKIRAKIRGIQVHHKTVGEAKAGTRTAINLQGVEKSQVLRGNVLVLPHTVEPTLEVDVFLEYLPCALKPLKDGDRVGFHIGTTMTPARVFLLEKGRLLPGDSSFARLKLEDPGITLLGDRFVLRGFSYLQTIGGGKILDPYPPKRRKYSKVSDLEIFYRGKEKEIQNTLILREDLKGISLPELSMRANLSLKGLSDKIGILVEDRVIHCEKYQELKTILLSKLKEYHLKYPLKIGILKEGLRSKLPSEVDPKIFAQLLSDFTSSGEIIAEKEKVRLSSHIPALREEQRDIEKRMADIYQKQGLQPLLFKEVVAKLAIEEEETRALLDLLVSEGRVIRVKEGLYFHKDSLNQLKEEIISFLKKNQEITVAQFKELTKTSRKYTIPLLEYFDQNKITLRVGEKRVLR